MAKMQWDNENQQFKLETGTLETNTFTITVPAYDNKKVFLGNINIKTNFTTYNLRTNLSDTIYLPVVSDLQVNREVISQDYIGDTYKLNTSNKGILVDNNKTYSLAFTPVEIISELTNKYKRGIRLDTQDTLVRIQSSYAPYWWDLKTDGIYVYFNLGGADATIQTNTNTYTFKKGGILWSQNDNGTVVWYMKRPLASGSDSITVKIEGSNPRLQAPAQSYVYQVRAKYEFLS